MMNRTLEELLKLNHYDVIIDILEGCENKSILEVRINKEEGFTRNQNIDKMIFDYLKKLKIKVVFIDDSKYHRSHNKFYKDRKTCDNAIHNVAKNVGKIESEILAQLSSLRFRIDSHSYISCPDCSDIMKLNSGEGNGTTKEN